MSGTTDVASSSQLEFDDAAVLDCFITHSKRIQEELDVRRGVSVLFVDSCSNVLSPFAETERRHGGSRKGCWTGSSIWTGE